MRITQTTGMWLLIIGASISLYDYFSDGSLYSAGKPLEKMKWKIATRNGSNQYLSISDAAAIAGAGILIWKR